MASRATKLPFSIELVFAKGMLAGFCSQIGRENHECFRLFIVVRNEMIEELKALKELLDMGAITQEEFKRKKEEILNQPVVPTKDNKVAQNTPAGSYGKSKVSAGLLAILLGSLGVHKFYLGYTKQGLIMLLVAIFGSILFGLGAIAMGIIALAEGIIYLTKSDEDFDSIYVRGKKEWF